MDSMDYHLTVKRNEVLTYATTLVNLENFMPNEGSQSQKTTHYDSIYLTCAEYANPETESRLVFS